MNHRTNTDRPASVVASYGRWLLVTVAGAATLTLTAAALGGAAAAPPEQLSAPAAAATTALPDSHEDFESCMRAVGGSADTLERWAGQCRSQTAEAHVFTLAYTDCMRGQGGSADALEQWVDYCSRRSQP
jgi:hypothetical protein